MIDPVTAAVLAVLVVAAAVFIFFARQGDDDSNFDKVAKETTKLLLSDSTKDKKHANKTKPAKKKQEKKAAEKKETEEKVVAAPKEAEPVPTVTVAEPVKKEKEQKQNKKEDKNRSTPVATSVESVPTAESSDKENGTVHQDSQNEIKKVSESSPEPNNSRSQKKTKSTSTKSSSSPRVEEVVALKNVSNDEQGKSKKKKKRGVPPSDLDQHKVIGHLASVEEIEPEYIAFLAQYFTDSAEKENALSNSVLSLEKQSLELRQKAEQHCSARISAEKELQTSQRLVNEMQKRLSTVEKDSQSDKSTISSLKQTIAESAANSSRNAEVEAELNKLRHAEKTATSRLQTALEELLHSHSQMESMQQEVNKARATTELANRLTAQMVEKDNLLTARANELSHINKEYSELEVAVRDLKAQLDEKNKEVHVSSSDVAEKEAAMYARDAAVIELSSKEQQWKERENVLMIEQKRLTALIEELNKEVAKFEQFKVEQQELQGKLVDKERELERKTKQLQEQEIVVSNEDSLKKENASLQSQLASVQKELEESRKTHEKEIAELKKKAEAAQESVEEIVVLKKADNLAAVPSTTSNAQIDELKKENNYLNEKNEELRKRNFKILDDVTALEKRLSGQPGPANPPASEKKSVVDHGKQIEEERSLVANTLQTIGNLPKLASGSDKKKYTSWLKDVSANLKKRIEEAENRIPSAPSSSPSDSDAVVEQYKSALVTLSSELARIETAWSTQTTKYEKIIEGLNKKLEKSNCKLSTVLRAVDELRECEEIKQQISSLRDSLNGSSPAQSPVETQKKEKRTTGMRQSAEEEDWEVVN